MVSQAAAKGNGTFCWSGLLEVDPAQRQADSGPRLHFLMPKSIAHYQDVLGWLYTL